MAQIKLTQDQINRLRDAGIEVTTSSSPISQGGSGKDTLDRLRVGDVLDEINAKEYERIWQNSVQFAQFGTDINGLPLYQVAAAGAELTSGASNSDQLSVINTGTKYDGDKLTPFITDIDSRITTINTKIDGLNPYETITMAAGSYGDGTIIFKIDVNTGLPYRWQDFEELEITLRDGIEKTFLPSLKVSNIGLGEIYTTELCDITMTSFVSVTVSNLNPSVTITKIEGKRGNIAGSISAVGIGTTDDIINTHNGNYITSDDTQTVTNGKLDSQTKTNSNIINLLMTLIPNTVLLSSGNFGNEVITLSETWTTFNEIKFILKSGIEKTFLPNLSVSNISIGEIYTTEFCNIAMTNPVTLTISNLNPGVKIIKIEGIKLGVSLSELNMKGLENEKE